MKILYSVSFILFFYFSAKAQTVDVSGQCMTGVITLSSISNINGKVAYQGTGTVDGAAGTIVSVYWLTPENVWVLDYDGQPYFQTTCNPSIPPATGGSCAWTVVSGTTCTGGAALVIAGSGVLPVKLVSFTAKKINKLAQLYWTTATEVSNRGFEIQRSNDGGNWTAIGFINGAGNSGSEQTYQFTDSNTLIGKNYYRLAQYDLDGNKTFSFVVNIDFSNSAKYYTIANNPGTGIYQLSIQSVKPVQLFVSDLSGKRLLNKMAGPGSLQLDISNYPAGIYLLHLKKDNETITEKLIKQ